MVLWVDAPLPREDGQGLDAKLRAFTSDPAEREEERLAARVLLERRRGAASPWATYLQALPVRRINALQFEQEHLAMLRGTYALEEVLAVRRRGDAFVHRFAAVGDDRDALLWALSIVISRGAVVLPRAPGGGPSNITAISHSPMHGRVLLVPGADLIRHKSGRRGAQWQLAREGNGSWAFRVVAGEGVVRGGVEVWHEYVAAGNAVLLARYGFAERGNDLDAIPLTVSWPSAAAEDAGAVEAQQQQQQQQQQQLQTQKGDLVTMSGSSVGRMRRALLHALGLQLKSADAAAVVVVVRGHASAHPRGHKSTDAVSARSSVVAALFNTARVASLHASEMTPDGVRRLHTLNHHAVADERAAAAVQVGAASLFLPEPTAAAAVADMGSSKFVSPWGERTGRGDAEHVAVPRRAEIQAMQALWSALQQLRRRYPTSASSDAALLQQELAEGGKKRRAVAGDAGARRHKGRTEQVERRTASDDEEEESALQQLRRGIVETRLGEMRLLDGVLQAIRANLRDVLGSADAVARLLDGLERDDL
jgi:hypothetical protein